MRLDLETNKRNTLGMKVLVDIRRVFEERDTDKSGRIDMSEMSAAMKDLKVDLSEDEVKTLFKVKPCTGALLR